MKKVIFFSGLGTAYTGRDTPQIGIDLYPETLSALRFLSRRGFHLALVTPERQEYKNFLSFVKDKALNITYCSGWEKDIIKLSNDMEISLKESLFITDGLYLQTFSQLGVKIILVLSGQGFCTLDSREGDFEGFGDICKNIYAAAFSAALNHHTLTAR